MLATEASQSALTLYTFVLSTATAPNGTSLALGVKRSCSPLPFAAGQPTRGQWRTAGLVSPNPGVPAQ